MIVSVRPAQFSILGMIAGVAVIPISVLALLFAVAKLVR
jgi:hypothetical protein